MRGDPVSLPCTYCGSKVPLLEETCPECNRSLTWSYIVPCIECKHDVSHQYERCQNCGSLLTEWGIVFDYVHQFDFHIDVKVSKNISHPELAGFEKGGGLPYGQLADYRMTLSDNTEIHIKEYSEYYLVHRDKCTVNAPLGHLLQDAPVETAAFGILLYHIFK